MAGDVRLELKPPTIERIKRFPSSLSERSGYPTYFK